MRRPGRAPSARSADAPGQREDRRVLGPVPTPDEPARGPPACDRLDSSRDARPRCASALRNDAVWGCMGGGGYSCSKTSKFLDMLKNLRVFARWRGLKGECRRFRFSLPTPKRCSTEKGTKSRTGRGSRQNTCSPSEFVWDAILMTKPYPSLRATCFESKALRHP